MFTTKVVESTKDIRSTQTKFLCFISSGCQAFCVLFCENLSNQCIVLSCPVTNDTAQSTCVCYERTISDTMRAIDDVLEYTE